MPASSREESAASLKQEERFALLKRNEDEMEVHRMMAMIHTKTLRDKRQRRAELEHELKDIQRYEHTLPHDIQFHEAMATQKRQELNNLGYSGDIFGLRQLADEELTLVLESFDLIDRLKYRVVCKRWRSLLADVNVVATQHVTISSRTTSDRILKKELGLDIGTFGLSKSDCKYQSQSVQTLIVSFAHEQADDDTSLTWYIPVLLSMRLAPALTHLYIANCLMRQPYTWQTIFQAYPLSSAAQVTYLNSLVSVLPSGDYRAGLTAILPAGPKAPVEKPFENLHRWFIRIPTLLVIGGSNSTFRQALEDATWPYDGDAMAWLCKHAWTLNVFRHLRLALEQLYRRHVRTPDISLLCVQHKQFCPHLNETHYQQFDGHFRRLLCLCIGSPPSSPQHDDFQRDLYIVNEDGTPRRVTRTSSQSSAVSFTD